MMSLLGSWECCGFEEDLERGNVSPSRQKEIAHQLRSVHEDLSHLAEKESARIGRLGKWHAAHVAMQQQAEDALYQALSNDPMTNVQGEVLTIVELYLAQYLDADEYEALQRSARANAICSALRMQLARQRSKNRGTPQEVRERSLPMRSHRV